MVAGAISFVAGMIMNIVLWQAGVVLGLAFFATAVGIYLFFSGLSDQRKLKDLLRQIVVLQERESAIITEMAKMKKMGKNPVPWLAEQGLTDIHLRGYLLKAMHDTLRADKPPA
jgi:hypothetical protein